jgi:hypothetical protein
VSALSFGALADGTESFGHLTPYPMTTGACGADGTVANYLEPQEVDIFFAMGERYGELDQRTVDVPEGRDPGELDRRSKRRHDVENMEAGTVSSTWFDVDATVAAYCRVQRRALLEGIKETIAVHIEAIEHWLSEFGNDAPPAT